MTVEHICGYNPQLLLTDQRSAVMIQAHDLIESYRRRFPEMARIWDGVEIMVVHADDDPERVLYPSGYESTIYPKGYYTPGPDLIERHHIRVEKARLVGLKPSYFDHDPTKRHHRRRGQKGARRGD